MDFVRRVFDRGRSLESIRRSTEFCLDTLAPCMFVLDGLKLIVGYSGNVFLIVTNDGRLEVCDFVNEMAQQVDILWCSLILQVTRIKRVSQYTRTVWSVLLQVISLAQMIKAGREFVKMDIPPKDGAIILVWKLIILREYNCLVFSFHFNFTVFSFGFWSMGNVSGYLLNFHRATWSTSLYCVS